MSDPPVTKFYDSEKAQGHLPRFFVRGSGTKNGKPRRHVFAAPFKKSNHFFIWTPEEFQVMSDEDFLLNYRAANREGREALKKVSPRLDQTLLKMKDE